MTDLSTSHSGFVRIADTRLFYEDSGVGTPLVLIHAGIADSRMWDSQFDVFAEDHRVIRFDLRGFGQTVCGTGEFADWEDMEKIFAALKIQPAIILGASMGARVAVEFALHRPGLVLGLILVSPGLFSDVPRSEPLAKGWKAMEAAFEAGDQDAMLEIETQIWVDGPRRKPHQVPASVRLKVREMNENAYALEADAAGRKQISPPAISRTAEINTPTLVVVGNEDQSDILGIADRLVGEIDGARKVMVSGAAHMLNMEQPDVFNSLILEFLDEQIS